MVRLRVAAFSVSLFKGRSSLLRCRCGTGGAALCVCSAGVWVGCVVGFVSVTGTESRLNTFLEGSVFRVSPVALEACRFVVAPELSGGGMVVIAESLFGFNETTSASSGCSVGFRGILTTSLLPWLLPALRSWMSLRALGVVARPGE